MIRQSAYLTGIAARPEISAFNLLRLRIRVGPAASMPSHLATSKPSPSWSHWASVSTASLRSTHLFQGLVGEAAFFGSTRHKLHAVGLRWRRRQ